MKTERWRQVEQLYHAAREREPRERDHFLQEACADDQLRGEVESLLRCESQAESFLEKPALDVTAEAFAEGRARSMFGRVLGHYEIVSFLGAGGMGEVYRARDSRIGRDVAVKVLPPAIARDPERLRRFEQEARAAGALNHPNILAIYDVGVHDGALYVVYELLEGETLRNRLTEGALSRRKAIEYASQIAAGLAAAHDKGITHRDLKPENLFVTRDGRIKILDFGLAKLTLPQGSAGDDTNLAALSPHREPGSILGTPGYMAPEQLRGGKVDHRSDLFNLGAILYEMLTGRRPFRGRSTSEVLNAILNDDPIEISETGDMFDPALTRLLRRCLEKNPYERVQSASDLAFDLEALLIPNERAQPSRWKKRGVGIALAVAVLSLVSFFAGRKLESVQRRPTPTFRRLTYRSGVITGARFAPDGQSIIYSAGWDGKPVEVFSTRVGSPESRPLGLPSAGVLAVSSAGELATSLGCELNWAECRGTLARMPLAGGAPREVLQDVFYADWTPDGKSLAVVRLVEGRFRLEYPIGKILYETGGWITYPRFSPQGDRIAFLDLPTLGEDSGSVSFVDLNGHKTTLSDGWKNLKGLAWSPSGNEVWFSGDRMTRSQFVYAVTLQGKERLVLQAPGWMRLQEISRDGRALLLQGSPRSRIVWQPPDKSAQRDLSWFDWSTAADLSADGKRLLFYEWGEGVAGNPTVYVRDTSGGDAVRLGEGRALALSPDGKWALALQAGPPSKLVLLPTGPGEEKALPPSGLVEYYSAAWFPDGKRILFVAAGSDRQPRSYVQYVGAGEARAITDEAVQATLISPDGKLLAAIGAEGDYQLRPVAGGEPRPIRGALPGDELIQWSSDGRFLFMRGLSDSVIEFFRVDLSTGRREPWKKIEAADPVGLIGFQPASVHMTPDGRSFIYTYWKVLTELYLVDSLN
jgi:serine/threonine protein kinase/Tol biopolymer transport system component